MAIDEEEWHLGIRVGVPIVSVLVFFAVSAATYFLDDPGLRKIKAARNKKLSGDAEISPSSTREAINHGTTPMDLQTSPSNGADYNTTGDIEALPLMVCHGSKVRSKPVKNANLKHQPIEVEPNMNNATTDNIPIMDHSLSANASISSVSGTSSLMLAALRSNLSIRRENKSISGQPQESNPPVTQTTITGNVPRRRTKSDSTVDVSGVKKTLSETQVHLDVLLTRMGPLRGAQPSHRTSRFVMPSAAGKRNFAVTTLQADGSQHSQHYPRSQLEDSRLEHKRFRTVSQDDSRHPPPPMHSPSASVTSVGGGGENFAGVGRVFSYNPQATVTSIASAYATIPAISEETDM